MMIFQFVGIQIFSAMYLVLILAVYSSKKRFSSVENNIFRILLFFTLIQLVIDIGMDYSIKYATFFPITNSILCRTSLFGYQIWTGLLMLYVLLLGDNHGYKTIDALYKSNKRIIIGTIVVFLLGIIVYFLPLNYLYDPLYRISYIVGDCTMYTYGVCLVYLLVILITVLINKNKVAFTKRLPILIFIITASIFLPIQRFNSDVPVLIIPLMSFAVMIMYFTLENPDLKLINELDRLKCEAEESNRIKTEFLSNISEDIRTPMNAILGFSETMLKDDLPIKVKSDAEYINSASRSLLEMINNILDISKIESGTVIVNENNYNLRNLLILINDLVNNSIKNDKIKFIISVDEKMPCNLIGDDDKILRIISNILSNAIKYTEVGRITLNIAGEKINNNYNLKIKISDTGVGIKEKDYDKIFEKFSRIDNILTKNVEGTGLGLAMSKKMVELLNGNICFESVYGGGTTFCLEFPQKISNEETIGQIDFLTFKRNELKIFDASMYNVLIVDENKLNARVLERMMEYYRINIKTCLSSDECINLIKSGKEFDLIFLEERMLDFNGVKTIHILKDLNLSKKTKIIALSTDTLFNSKNYYQKKGFDNYLIKPIDILQLSEMLNKYLNKK